MSFELSLELKCWTQGCLGGVSSYSGSEPIAQAMGAYKYSVKEQSKT